MSRGQMTGRLFFYLITLVLCTGFSALQASAQQHTDAATPQLTLRAYWHDALMHDKRKPLLLTLVISNDAAYDIELRNHEARLLKHYYDKMGQSQNRDQIQTFTPEQASYIAKVTRQETVPLLKLGSPNKNSADFVSFLYQRADGTPAHLSVRQLKQSTAQPGVITLDANTNSIDLFFGVEPQELQKLEEGTYKIKASLSIKGEKDSWNGDVESNEVSVDLKNGPPDAETAKTLYHYGRYYLLDADYAKADEIAEQLRTADVDSISACELHGDAALGRRDALEARKWFERGIALYQAKWKATTLPPNKILEPPTYMQTRLEEASK